MSAQAIRTWTLLGEHGAHTVLGEKLPPFHRVRVGELEPLLDILEKARLLFPELDGTNLPKSALETEIEELEPVIENLLREHGRLQ